MKFEQLIPKNNGELHHVLIGKISSSKTSFMNYCCGGDLPVGVGETTLDAAKLKFGIALELMKILNFMVLINWLCLTQLIEFLLFIQTPLKAVSRLFKSSQESNQTIPF